MNRNIIYTIGAILITGAIAFFTLRNDHADGTVHEDGSIHGGEKTEEKHDDHADHAHEKMVHLNDAQYKNAGIDTGWFEMKNLSEIINTNGYTKLPPQNQADVAPFIGGTVQTIKVIEGQYVKKGQTLAMIQSLGYNNIRLEKAKLTEHLESSQTTKKYLELEYARQKELSDENVNAKKVFQKAASDLDFETKRIANLSSQIEILTQNLQIGGSSQSPNLAITAPISGYVSEVYVKIGTTAEIGKPMFSIVDNSQMHVDLLVYEKDLYKVKPGQSVRFILTNQGNQEIKGKIFNVGKTFENDTKSVAVHADIVNDKQMLIPGMYVNALIDIGVNKVETLPIEAVVNAEGRTFIFLWEKENLEAEHKHKAGEEAHEKETSFARIEVKTGASQLGYIQVTPLVEIHKGDKIVTRGSYYLQSHLQKSEGGGHSH